MELVELELAVARFVGRVVAGQIVEKAAGQMRYNLGSRGSGVCIQTQNRRLGI